MHKINEVEKYMEKYNGFSHKQKFILNSSFDYNSLLEKLLNSKFSDCPDMYYTDKKEQKIFIFEHFEIDNCSHSKKKGSKLQVESNRDLKKYNDFCKNSQNNKFENDYTSCFKIDSSIENYYDCLRNSFNKHIKSIKNYKKNILKVEGLDEIEWKFFISFIIEDTSIFGSLYNNKEILFPIFIKEFMNLFRMLKMMLIVCFVQILILVN